MMCYILALTADPLFTLPKQNMQLIISERERDREPHQRPSISGRRNSINRRKEGRIKATTVFTVAYL